MNGTKVQQIAMDTAMSLPAVTYEHPFGPDWEVFKVKGKVFLLVTEVPGEPIAVMKCEPDHSKALQQDNDAVTPGYHMNKQHWITLHGGSAMTARIVRELVSNAYELVVEGLPKHQRPLNSAQPLEN